MTHSAPNVLERFLHYVQFDTQSDETSAAAPSTAKQLKLAEALKDELHQLGIANAVIGQGGVVYAQIPASRGCEDLPAVGFIAHMDTSPDASGLHVKPQIIRFDGTDVLLNQTEGIRFPVERFPEIKKYIGEDVIFTDGTTLLGADDKSGIAAIMDMAAKITADPKIAHAKLCIAFTPDEEIGEARPILTSSASAQTGLSRLTAARSERWRMKTSMPALPSSTFRGSGFTRGAPKERW